MKKRLGVALSVMLFLLVSGYVYAGSCTKDADCKGSKECINGECQEPSGELGAWSWSDANSKCSSLGMRLPSIEELKAAYKSGVTKSWNGNYHYWSSTASGGHQLVMNAHSGQVYVSSSPHTDIFLVHCFR
jgi:hypothetical protein